MHKDINTEACILSGVFSQPEFVLDVIENLSEERFYYKRHKIIFKAMREMFNKNISIDILTLINYLKSRNKLKEAGGAKYINEISDFTYSAAHGKDWIKILNNAFILRQLDLEAKNTISAINNGGDVAEILSDAQKRILSISDTNKQEYKHISDIAQDFMEEKENIISGKKVIDKYYTGIEYIDSNIDIVKGRLVVVGAKRSVGKSVFALSTGFLNARSADRKVGIISLEMVAKDVLAREIPRTGTITLDRVNHLNREDAQIVFSQLSEIENAKILINDDSSLTLSNIRSKALKMKYELQGLDLLIVDYLQLISSSDGDNREQRIASLSRGLKAIAKDLDIAVIAPIQLNANGEARESKAIEQDADIFIKIQRPYFENDNQEVTILVGSKEVEVTDSSYSIMIISKNRYGATGRCEAWFEGRYQRFVDYRGQMEVQ